MTSFDIVIPCYNYGRYLEQCVASVLGQPGVEVRVLIIDDQSSDETPQVAARLCATDTRVCYRRHETNQGHIATYNEGLSQANADCVVLLSADDLLTPGALQRAAAVLDAHPSVGLVYGHAVKFSGDAMPTSARTRTTGATVWRGRDWISRMCRVGRNFITCPEVVMRTHVQHRIGGYRPALPHTGDMEMWLRAAAVCDVARINGADQAYYRVHPLSMQRTVNAGTLRDMRGRLAAFESALTAPPAPLEGARELLSLAQERMATEALDEACRAFDRGLVGSEPVDDYVRFALGASPRARSLPQWRALQLRRRVGPQWSPFFPPFFLAAALRRAKLEIRTARWRRYGI